MHELHVFPVEDRGAKRRTHRQPWSRLKGVLHRRRRLTFSAGRVEKGVAVHHRTWDVSRTYGVDAGGSHHGRGCCAGCRRRHLLSQVSRVLDHRRWLVSAGWRLEKLRFV
jgi:hypothetical protein